MNATTIYGAVELWQVTQLGTLASDPTQQWSSQEVSNEAAAWEDVLVGGRLEFAATAPAGSQAVFIFATSALDTTVLAGGDSRLTGQPDVTTGPSRFILAARVPYRVTGSPVAIPPFSIAALFGGTMPPTFQLVLVNHSGAMIAAGSVLHWRGVRTRMV